MPEDASAVTAVAAAPGPELDPKVEEVADSTADAEQEPSANDGEAVADANEDGSDDKKGKKAPKKPKVVKASEMGCLNHEELSWIWIGDAEDARDSERLKKNNVRYILNCTPERTDGGVMNFHIKDPWFTYQRIAMGDNATENLSNRFQTAWDFFEKAHIREDGGILVHCQQGVSRSVSMVVCYLMKYYRMNFDECLALIRPSRPQAAPNEGFTQQLKQLWEKLESTNGFEKRPQPRKRPAADLAPEAPPGKRRAVGPAMGPSVGPSAGPRQVGPARGPVGPSVGPSPGPSPRPQVGPARGPVGPAAPPGAVKGPAAGPAPGPAPEKKKVVGPAKPPKP
mmetsp:Transcript_68385/g.164131  ORF Transcript_68385/g.164131 Transcript_68385/m.164131 type:complete len:339 (-) Transcript_68385:60-1076(-)